MLSFFSGGDKDRLVLCLYHRSAAPKMPGGEDEFHWALGVLPKIWHPEGAGTLHHAKDNPPIPGISKWTYQTRELKSTATPNLLCRIVIAKVANSARLETILESIPLSQRDPAWNCVVWVKDALEALDADKTALGTRQLGWITVRDKALQYVKDKRDMGRFKAESNHDRRKPPTYDLLNGRELLP